MMQIVLEGIRNKRGAQFYEALPHMGEQFPSACLIQHLVKFWIMRKKDMPTDIPDKTAVIDK